MHLYEYYGSVMEFDKIVTRNWKASTYAISEKKARSNLVYQYKSSHNKSPATNVRLPGEVRLVR